MQKKSTATTNTRRLRNKREVATVFIVIAIMCVAGVSSELPPYATSESLDRPTIFGTEFISTELP